MSNPLARKLNKLTPPIISQAHDTWRFLCASMKPRKVGGLNKPHFNFWYIHQYLIIIFLLLPSLLYAESGKASFYGAGEKLNKHTANREVFNPNALTAATYNYPFNTMLKVTNLENKKFVIVRVNDRGPNKRLGRAIDLTRQAFSQIASLDEGIIEVKIEEVN